MTTKTIAVSEIKIGHRHRKDFGDIDGLAKSIEEVGLLHPVVVTPDNVLIAGSRRIAAFQRLKHDEIPVTIVNIEGLVLGEQAENIERKDFTVEERVAIGRAIEELIGDRRGQRTDLGQHPENFPDVRGRETRAIVAEKAGFGNPKTYEQAKEVVDAANADPARFGRFKDHMNSTGKVHGAYRRVEACTQAEAIRNEVPPPPGSGPYRVVAIHQSWLDHTESDDPAHTRLCLANSVKNICKLVDSIAHEDCVLWLWTTNAGMRQAFDVLDACGFEFKTLLTLIRPSTRASDWLRDQSEHCLMAVRGNPVITLTNQSTVLHAAGAESSSAPDGFYDLVESLCPAVRNAVLWDRSPGRHNWDGHGHPSRRHTP